MNFSSPAQVKFLEVRTVRGANSPGASAQAVSLSLSRINFETVEAKKAQDLAHLSSHHLTLPTATGSSLYRSARVQISLREAKLYPLTHEVSFGLQKKSERLLLSWFRWMRTVANDIRTVQIAPI